MSPRTRERRSTGSTCSRSPRIAIRKIDPKTGQVLGTIPAPGGGGDLGLAWAEGTLWVGQHRGRKIHQVDPETGAVLRTIKSDRFVTGVTWVDGELWHGTWQDDDSDVRRIDPRTGEVLERLEMPRGTGVSGLESDGGDQFFCGGGSSGTVRAIRRPRRTLRCRRQLCYQAPELLTLGGIAPRCHCEERSDEAISCLTSVPRLVRQEIASSLRSSQ